MSLKSRYSIAQVNSNYYSTISVSDSYTASGTKNLGQGYIWVPYIPININPIVSSSKGFIINTVRKIKIANIIDKL